MRMFDILRMSWFEFKKIFCKKAIYIYLIIFCLFTGPLLNKLADPKNIKLFEGKISHIKLLPVVYLVFMLFVYSINVLLEEYRNGTMTFLFTSKMSRTKILFSKVLAINLLGIVLGFINYFFNICFEFNLGTSNYLQGSNIIFMYLLFSWFTGNYFLFISSIFKSRFASFLVGIFLLSCMSDIVLAIKNKISSVLFELNPFDNFMLILGKNEISPLKIIGLVSFGFIFFQLAVIIFNKKDLS